VAVLLEVQLLEALQTGLLTEMEVGVDLRPQQVAHLEG